MTSRQVPTGDGTSLIRAITPPTSPEQIAETLRLGFCPAERAFDFYLPPDLRVVSAQFWTPLRVAQKAAQWFSELGVRSVVDVGSGAGKFCVAAALAGSASYVGVEQRPRLVAAATALAELFKLADRVRFEEGTFGTTGLPVADAYYLFNPFGENLFDTGEHLDQDVELSDERYLHDIAVSEQFLKQAPVGTYLITYNGFGGSIPGSFDEVRVDRELPNVLRMWRKNRARSSGKPASADEI